MPEVHAGRLTAAALLAKIHHQVLGDRLAADHRQALAVGPDLGAVAAAQNPVGILRFEAVLAVDLAQELEIDQLPATAAQLQIPEGADGVEEDAARLAGVGVGVVDPRPEVGVGEMG